MKFWKRKPKPRIVGLVKWSGDVVVVQAIPGQSGWMARWIKNPDEWSLLLPGGKTRGTDLVKSWFKVSGWPEEPADTEDA